MTIVFEKLTNADGTETYKEVELSTLDVREHPAYQEVLKEQVKSRQKAAEYKKQLLEVAKSSDEDAPAPEVKSEVAPVAIPSPEAVADLVEKRLAEKQAKAVQEKTALDTQVTNAMVKHGLPPSARSVVENSRDPEAMAETLAKSGLTFANSPSGGDDKTEISTLFANIDKRMGFA